MNRPGPEGLPDRQTANSTTTETNPVGIAVFTPDRLLRHCNRHFPALTGLPRGFLVAGLRFDDMMSALQHRTQAAGFRRARRDGLIIDVKSEPMPDGGNVTIVTDVSLASATEEALMLSRSAVEAAHAAKTRFLASITTEFRAPLATILAEAATISANKPLDSTQLARAGTAIDASARSLLGLVDGILDLARFENGRFDLVDDTVDLAQLLRSTCRRFDPQAAAADVVLVIEVPDNLPPIRADEHRLRQILSDVVAHALAFTAPFGSVSIRARRDWASGGLLLQVQNTGPGMQEHDLERVFEPFLGLGATTRENRKRAGLGLYVSRILMRAHGGDLVLHSVPGQGTTTTLHIPAERVMQEAGYDTN